MKHYLLAGACAALLAVPSFAGSILLTGHDVLLHGGQRGFDDVTLDYLRGAGTASEILAGNYSLAVIGSGVGSWNFTEGGLTKPGYESTTYYDTDDFVAGTESFAEALTADALIILSHTSCGGCDLSTPGSDFINSQSAAIATAFNAGMDIWGLSGGSLSTYYDFLPPGAIASGLPIGGSSGFTSTAAGAALGFTDTMINGFPTHNRFIGFDSAFTVLETRGEEVITLGIRDARIVDGGIETPGGEIPEPSTYMMMLGGLISLVAVRRRNNA